MTNSKTNRTSTSLALLLTSLFIGACCSVLFTIYRINSLPIKLASSDKQPPPKNRTYYGSDLLSVIGAGEISDAGSLIATQFKDERFLAISKTSLNTESYPFFKYKIKGVNPEHKVFLIWRTGDNEKIQHHIELPRSWSNSNTVFLSNDVGWSGTIREIGIDVYGNLQDGPVSIELLQFKPSSLETLVTSILQNWTTLSTWSQKSVNDINWTESEVIKPNRFFGEWLFFSLVFLIIASRYYGHATLATYCLVILPPWMAIDLMWQINLAYQNIYTSSQFMGKSIEEKKLNDIDGEIYRFTQEVRSNFKPSSQEKFWVIDRGNNTREWFGRYRSRYYLQPLDTNVKANPKAIIYRAGAGDNLLILSAIPDVTVSSSIFRFQDSCLPISVALQSDEMYHLKVKGKARACRTTSN